MQGDDWGERCEWVGRGSWAAPGSGEKVGGNQGVVEERAGLLQPDRRGGEILLVRVVRGAPGWSSVWISRIKCGWRGRCCGVLFRNTKAVQEHRCGAQH